MLTIKDACRRPFATITIVMVANGRRQLDRGDISGDLTDFSSINGSLGAVKGSEKRNLSHDKLT